VRYITDFGLELTCRQCGGQFSVIGPEALFVLLRICAAPVFDVPGAKR
jgi:hypothetical protein